MSRLLFALVLILSGCHFHIETNDEVEVKHCTVELRLFTGEEEGEYE